MSNAAPVQRPLLENLQRVRLLLAGKPDSTDSVRHTHKAIARDKTGKTTTWFSEDARKWSLLGAVYRAVDDQADRNVVYRALRAHIPDKTPTEWYERDHNVVELVDKAIGDCT